MIHFGRVLPNRKHVVLTNNPDFKVDNENVEIVHSVDDIKKYIESEEENFVIGGAMIYNLLMPYVTKLYITEIYKVYDGDAVFPAINEEKWKPVNEIKSKDKESGIEYSFVDYVKK